MAELPEGFHAASFVLCAAGSFGCRRAAQFGDDLRYGGGAGINCAGAGDTT